MNADDTSVVKHSDYHALVAPYKTVCQGYELLTYKMLKQAGINTKIVIGTGNGESHAWNLVYLVGKWYQLDTTWDDSVPNATIYQGISDALGLNYLSSDLTVNAAVSPVDATSMSLTWTSSNTNIATVDSKGTVHAVVYGSAVITAKSVQDSTKVATCTMLVLAPAKHY